MSFDFNTVTNQSPALENYNLFTSDKLLQDITQKTKASWITETAIKFGEMMGRSEVIELGNQANRYAPVLKTHDRFGNRLDIVEYHPAYHELMRLSMQHELHSLTWKTDKPGRFVARAVLVYLKHQIDEGTSCPLTMTFACVPTLRINPVLAGEWLPKVLSEKYDLRFLPVSEKQSATFGMAMTEPQGGSDIRTNLTFAEKLDRDGSYEITGRKWFCSAPMSDAFFILAQTCKGLSCFLLPRFTPDGRKNNIHFQRLKEKLGNRSNASSEVEFHGARGWIIGEEGRGVANIMETVRHTRLDCVVGSAATLRRVVAEAIHHCKYRRAFGKSLIDQPLMKNLLADLVIESEASTAFAFRLARSFDEADSTENEAIFSRFAVAVGKFWVCRRAIYVVSEALEILGGNGYVEESIMPRLYRDVPVNSIWEGAGNIQCLDLLRSMRKMPDMIEILFQEFERFKGLNSYLDQFVSNVKIELSRPYDAEFRARKLTEKIALALQACALFEYSAPFMADAFCTARLNAERSFSFGALDNISNIDEILARSSFTIA